MSKARSMTPEILWKMRTEFWKENADAMIFQAAGIKPQNAIDTLNLNDNDEMADALHDLGKQHHVDLQDAALPIFQTHVFFRSDDEGDGVLAHISQGTAEECESGVWGIKVVFIATDHGLYMGITLDESHGDSGGPAEVAVLSTYEEKDMPDDEFDIIAESINEDYLYATDYKALYRIGCYMRFLWNGVQYRIINRPETVRLSHRRLPKEDRGATGHRGNKARIVKIQKIISILADGEPEDVICHTVHTYSLPVWNVAGHWRTLPCGRKVWIRPYQKGKERNTGSNCAKEYRFVEDKL